ncbi:hypothetical protein C010_02166 [Brucella ovis 80/125]|nr:hypothetical protein C010_02166 [Brucella ovis 80/125]ENS93824.1 hypothetical protein B999_02145 [Brucella ovis 63/96]ENS95420.1 hypothetical protein C009_03199 [Brucella ovis 81/8]ENT82207.1 hypothetical protein H713_02150 [Brucella ovis IntaBari-2010-47-268]
MNIEPETKREIIIVRRGGHDDHEAHHDGDDGFFPGHVAHQCCQ